MTRTAAARRFQDSTSPSAPHFTQQSCPLSTKSGRSSAPRPQMIEAANASAFHILPQLMQRLTRHHAANRALA
jgi:hypothetical protein